MYTYGKLFALLLILHYVLAVATNIIALASGTVVFEDVGSEYYTGQVLKPLDRTFKAISLGMDGKAPEEALNGRVKYRGVDRSEVEVPFGEKDQVKFWAGL